jgi:hypothetical protein
MSLSQAESDNVVGGSPVKLSPEKDDSPSPQISMRTIERFSAMMSVGPGRDSFVEKMTPEHVTAVIVNKDKDGERKHTEELAKINNHKWYAVGAGVFVIVLCALFLAFKQTDHLDAVLGTLAGLAGGFGIGKATHGSDKHP